jgi:hypothetical protein
MAAGERRQKRGRRLGLAVQGLDEAAAVRVLAGLRQLIERTGGRCRLGSRASERGGQGEEEREWQLGS